MFTVLLAAGQQSTPWIASFLDDSYVTEVNGAEMPFEHETTIWELDTTTGQLFPHWINPDGSSAEGLELVYVKHATDSVRLCLCPFEAF